MQRRDLIKGAVLGTIGFASLGSTFAAEQKKVPKYPNEHFYKNGKLDMDVAKNAYRELFKFHNYSLAETVIESPEFWIVDFSQNDFSNVGMGGIFFINDKEHGYFGHEIYLLPYQMIVEHYHVPAENLPAKHEAWQVRHGSIWTVSPGGSKETAIFPVPESQKKTMTCFDAKFHNVGDIEILRKLEEPHFMMAGPEGAIVTEYASYHAQDGLKFTNPDAAL